MKKKKELKVTVVYQPAINPMSGEFMGRVIWEADSEDIKATSVSADRTGKPPGATIWTADGVSSCAFSCSISGTGIDADKYDFFIGLDISQENKGLNIVAVTQAGNSPLKMKRKGEEVYFYFAADFAPIARAIQDYKPTKSEYKHLGEFFKQADPETIDIEFFEILLKGILQKADYRVVIEKIKPPYFYLPTFDTYSQHIYKADKRDNFISDLMAIGKGRHKPQYDEKGINVIGFRIEADVPSARTVDESIQLSFDFNFMREGGFKMIPLKKIDDPEIKHSLDETLQEIETKISKNLDPLALRVKNAIICMSQYKANRAFDFRENELLDLLYDRPKGKKYHDTRYKNRIRKRLHLLSEIRLSYAIKIGNETRRIDDIPIIILNPEGQPSLEVTYENGKLKRKYNFKSIQISKRYQYILFDKFTYQVSRESLKLPGNKYSLYNYIASWWRIQWIKQNGVYEWWLSDILKGAGITPPTKAHTARFIKKLNADLDEMKKNKLIGSYKRLNKNQDPISDKWQFVAPADLKSAMEYMGKVYQENQEMKKLKAKKRKLKLESDIIELKKKS